jgi:tape measure domain-containing protein
MASTITLSTIFNAVDKVSRPMQRIAANTKKSTNSMTRNFDRVGKSLDRMRNLLMGGALVLGFKKMLNAGMEMENLTTDFKVLTGSMEEAGRVVEELQKKGASTPFEFADLANSTKTLMQFGLTAEDSMSMLDMMGDISMGNKERLQGLSLVMGQVASNGKLMGQDLLQMINQGFNPLVVISKKTGRSMEDLRKAMSRGEISFEMVKDAMKSATEEGGQFYKGMEEGSKTLSGKWSTLMDSVTMLSVKIMTGLMPSFKRIIESITIIANDIGKWFDANKELIGSGLDVFMGAIETSLSVIVALWNSGFLPVLLISIGVFKVMVAVMTAYNAVLAWYTATQAAASAAGGLFNFVLMACPAVWIVAAIMLIVGAVYLLWKHWDKIVPFFQWLWEKIKEYFWIGIKWVWNIMAFTNPIFFVIRFWGPITDFFKWLWEKVAEYFWIGVDWIKEALFFLSPALLIYRHWDKIVDFFTNLWDSVSTATVSGVSDISQTLFGWTPAGLLYNNWGAIIGFFTNLWGTVKGVVMEAVGYISAVIEQIWGKITGVVNKIRDMGQKVKGFFTGEDSAASPNSAVIRSTSENRSTVDVNFNNAPSGTQIRNKRPAPGVNLRTGPAT